MALSLLFTMKTALKIFNNVIYKNKKVCAMRETSILKLDKLDFLYEQSRHLYLKKIKSNEKNKRIQTSLRNDIFGKKPRKT